MAYGSRIFVMLEPLYARIYLPRLKQSDRRCQYRLRKEGA